MTKQKRRRQQEEHSACGTGFIADPKGPSHDLVLDALEVLARYKHRGAVAVDGKTGDGAGILTQLPKKFFGKAFGIGHEDFGVGMFFLPTGDQERLAAQGIIEQELANFGLRIAGSGWRDVPMDESRIGEIAQREKPAIRQLAFEAADGNTAALEERIYQARKAIEARFVAAEKENKAFEQAYVCSMSSTTIVYKGLMRSDQVAAYTDLLDEDYEAGFAIVHSRFSTNTVSTWKGAHPYPGGLAHNGEINTIAGNQQQYISRVQETDGGDFAFIPKQSDSGRLDAALNHEIQHEGKSLRRAMMYLVPPAWQHDETLSAEERAMFEYWSLEQAPFDGPAHLVATDGRYMMAHLDRGGFRPSRYMIAKDGRVVVGSEEGVYGIPEDQIAEYGRLAAGEALVVDTQTGRVWKQADLLKELAEERDDEGRSYTQLLEARKRTLKAAGVEAYQPALSGEALIRQAQAYGWHDEVLNLFIGPMVAEGKENTVSMGDDTPMPCMSALPWDLSYYFKQRFAQVTNPPVDSVREGGIMSLRVALGPKASVVPDARQIVLDSPLLRPGQLREIMEGGHVEVRTPPLSMTYNAAGGKAALEDAVRWLQEQAIAAAKEGRMIVLSDREVRDGEAVIPAALAVAAVHEALRDAKVRLSTSILVETGQVTNPHQAALLLGMGASAIDMFGLRDMAVGMWEEHRNRPSNITTAWFTEDTDGGKREEMSRRVAAMSRDQVLENTYKAMDAGIKKVMSKMGINDVESYIGGKQFEAVGLDLDPEREPLLAQAFRTISSQVAGHGLEQLAENQFAFQAPVGKEAKGKSGLVRFGMHVSLKPRDGVESHGFSKQKISAPLNDYADGLLESRLMALLLPEMEAFLKGRSTPSAAELADRALAVMVDKGVGVGALRFGRTMERLCRELVMQGYVPLAELAPAATAVKDALNAGLPPQELAAAVEAILEQHRKVLATMAAFRDAYLEKMKPAAEEIKAFVSAAADDTMPVAQVVEAVDAILAKHGAAMNLGEIGEAIEKSSGKRYSEHEVLDVYEARQVEKEKDRAPRAEEDINAHRITPEYRGLMATLRGYGDDHPTALRDMLWLKTSMPVEEVDDAALARVSDQASDILKTFASGAMSDGAMTRLGHAALAIGMNNVGARSNTGEGGERPVRWQSPLRNGKIKQVASGRFGVTAEYLASVPEDGEIEIKIAQGAKPGEGGQLPGSKVSIYIASNRSSLPGVELISPPPHHDIYSIEDLAQLVYDLKAAGRRVSVKLVATEGIGTIAVGVAKALMSAGLDEDGLAGTINIAGNSGGTGAAPVTSAYHAGISSELGLAEADKALRDAGLRDLIRLRASGGIKTAEDIVKMAILGADEFEFGTLAMNLLGCQMIKKCHIPGACSPGVANNLKGFEGESAVVEEFMMNLAHEVREYLAALGVASLKDLRGRVDLLEQVANPEWMRGNMDLSTLLEERTPIKDVTAQERDNLNQMRTPRLYDAYEKQIVGAIERVRERGYAEFDERILLEGGQEIPLTNSDRSVGAKIAIELARQAGNSHRRRQGSERLVVPEDFVTANFTGSAGQSFGVFMTHGMDFHLKGVAQDYVGKNMSGGVLALEAIDELKDVSDQNVIGGNTALYGATGGHAFFNGQMGDRFAVRNSGAIAVVEGVGDFACEYMTSGTVLNLGDVGKHFGVGMSGGIVYQFDPDGARLEAMHLKQGGFSVYSISPGHAEVIGNLLREHYEHTQSEVARQLLVQMEIEPETVFGMFHMIVPKTMERMVEAEEDRSLINTAALHDIRKVEATVQAPMSAGMQAWLMEQEEAARAAGRLH